MDDKTLEGLVHEFIAEGMAAQAASEGLASQTSMSLDAFFAACHTSQVGAVMSPAHRTLVAFLACLCAQHCLCWLLPAQVFCCWHAGGEGPHQADYDRACHSCGGGQEP